MKSVLRFLGFKKGESKRHLKDQGATANLSKRTSLPPNSDTFRVGGLITPSPSHHPRVHSYHNAETGGYYSSSDVDNYLPSYQITSSPDIVGFQNSPRTVVGDESYSHSAINNSEALAMGCYPNYHPNHQQHSPSSNLPHHLQQGARGFYSAGSGPGNGTPTCVSAKEEHTPDLLSAGEQLQSITFHSPLWMKRDFPSRSSMRKKAMTGRRLPADMNVRFNDMGGYEESMTDSELIRRNKISQQQMAYGKLINNDPSDLDTDAVTTDVDSCTTNSGSRRSSRKKGGKRGSSGDHQGNKFFSRHASLRIKSGKRRNDKNQMLGSVAEHGTGGVSDGANGESGRRASVPESKRSMTDTEQRGDSNYEETDFSEAENSLFNMAMPSFISSLNFNKLGGGRNHHSNHSHHHQSSNNVDNFKRQGSTGNLMRRPFSAIRNHHPSGAASNYSETEMTDSARSVKKSLSSDNFQGSGILAGGTPATVKHKVGQGLSHSSLVAPPTKTSRKHSKATFEDNMVSLFEAVEVCHLDKVSDLLNIGVRDLNAPNEDDFTVLDLATLLNFDVMAAELLRHGARENPKFMVKELRIQHVNHLLKRCDAQIQVLLPALVTAAQSSSTNNSSHKTSSHSGNIPKETELRFWEWRQRLLAKMKACFELARAPEPPTKIEISVTSSTSVRVTFTPPKSTNGSLVTRYKIAWSKTSSFETIEGEHVLLDLRDLEFVIRGLTCGVEIFVRVSAANIKGFGLSQLANPPSAIPSHWRDICNKERRCSGKKVTELSLMYEQVKYSCLGLTLDSNNSNGNNNNSGGNNANSSTSPSKRNLKHLLPIHPKFAKSLTKGVYLSCALYTPDDRVVVTSDDVIPTVEVDEGTPANISQDFHWFLKLSVVWDDIPTLCQDLSVTSSNTSISFRAKLVQAVFSLQNLLSWKDIGRVYHRVLRDNHGNMIFVLIGHLPDNKCPSGSGVKLSPLSKVVGKRKPKLDLSSLNHTMGSETNSLSGAPGTVNGSSGVGGGGGANFSSSVLDDFSALDMLFLDLEELIRFHQNQETSLKPGLYLTLVKAESSINTLNVQVPYNCPNMTSCVKVRDNPHVSRDEWAWIYNSNVPISNQNHEHSSSNSLNPSISSQHLKMSTSSSAATITNNNNPNNPQSIQSTPLMSSSGSYNAISLSLSSSSNSPSAIQSTNSTTPGGGGGVGTYGLTMSQANFRRSLAIAAGKLFKRLAIKDDNGYRIYKDEIVEVNSDVSVILMLPPEVTSVNKYSDTMSSNHGSNHSNNNSHNTHALQLVPLTVQLFEFTHLMVYQHYITSAYCRLCCLVDNLTLVANYQIREAFTDDEMRSAKKRLETLSETADKTEIIWHSMRWLLDILQQNRMARNKLGIHLKTLLDTSSNVLEHSGTKSLQSQTSLPNGGQKQFIQGVNNNGSQSHLNALRNVSQNHLTTQNIASSGITSSGVTASGSVASSAMTSSRSTSSKCIVLQVFPRFNCGLPRGTSVRVVINSKATCKDVVQLVVSELSKVALSHNPLLTWDANPDLFQLCVIIGENVEQTLPENLPPVPCAEYQSSSVKYIVKLKTNANYFSKYSDI
ncbi:uncharacterized protein LOC142342709 isoform X2 [Convolutriloba macropyga]|uniref:uncharacterized protein LOC142342709 isoform X2 n=1 Tax=Convolutriloba macropyga TaxID=536237 RepID=UPI003F5287F1